MPPPNRQMPMMHTGLGPMRSWMMPPIKLPKQKQNSMKEATRLTEPASQPKKSMAGCLNTLQTYRMPTHSWTTRQPMTAASILDLPDFDM